MTNYKGILRGLYNQERRPKLGGGKGFGVPVHLAHQKLVRAGDTRLVVVMELAGFAASRGKPMEGLVLHQVYKIILSFDPRSREET